MYVYAQMKCQYWIIMCIKNVMIFKYCDFVAVF